MVKVYLMSGELLCDGIDDTEKIKNVYLEKIDDHKFSVSITFINESGENVIDISPYHAVTLVVTNECDNVTVIYSKKSKLEVKSSAPQNEYEVFTYKKIRWQGDIIKYNYVHSRELYSLCKSIHDRFDLDNKTLDVIIVDVRHPENKHVFIRNCCLNKFYSVIYKSVNKKRIASIYLNVL